MPEQDIPPQDWSLESRFPAPSGGQARQAGRSLFDSQRIASNSRRCSIQIGDDILNSTRDSYSIQFTCNVATLHHKFELEFVALPAPGNEPNKEAKTQAYLQNRFGVHFSAHQVDDAQTLDRQVVPYRGPVDEADTPQGQYTFSSQLKNVQFTKRSSTRYQHVVMLPEAVDQQYVVTWKSDSFQKFSFTRDLTSMPENTQNAAKQFQAMMTRMVEEKLPVYVVMVRLPNLLRSTWPRFVSLPSPPPPTYFPWLRGLQSGEEPQKMLDWSGFHHIEVDRNWIETALRPSSDTDLRVTVTSHPATPSHKRVGSEMSSRTPTSAARSPLASRALARSTAPALPGGYQSHTRTTSSSSARLGTSTSSQAGQDQKRSSSSAEFNKVDPLQSESLIPLPEKIQFEDAREYLAHVIGSHTYEEFESDRTKYAYVDGDHFCDVFVLQGTQQQYFVLLNIRPPSSAQTTNDDTSTGAEATARAAASREAGAGGALPDAGERVSIELVVDRNIGEERWQGRVVDIPSGHKKHGFNVAVLAVRPERPGGRVLEPRRILGRFQFGHTGSSSSLLRERIIELMVSSPKKGWRDFILAKDNHHLDVYSPKSTGWQEDVMRKYIIPRGLNEEQASTVKHYLTNRVTLLSGPPGTGKTTLIDTILEIEEDFFKTRFWVCADSNAAVDVLVNKYVKRKGNRQVEQVYRVRPAFDESHVEEDRSGGSSGLSTLPGFVPLSANVADNVAAEAMKQGGGGTKTLSLSAAVSGRGKRAYQQTLGDSYYKQELMELAALNKAHHGATSIRLEDNLSLEERNSMEHSLKLAEIRALRTVQRSYVAAAKGIFSTASAASNTLMQKLKPRALIIDEASQMPEAKATHVLAHAVLAGDLERVLMVGDENQLPPTITASRNVFRNTASMSQFERLIKAGTPRKQLKEQYRSHPQISKTYNRIIYGGALRDHPSTAIGPAVAGFSSFVRQYYCVEGKHPLKRSSEPICSVVLSPIRNSKVKFGSDRRPGSTSRVNYQTAAMVMINCIRLIENVKPESILVTAFYSDQVIFLKALLAGHPLAKNIRVSTVDGSQGEEALVHIIDCVVLGGQGVEGGAGDTLGFLSVERRRFNVAMSRGKAGRIVIGHSKMADNPHNKTSVWAEFMKEETAANHVFHVDVGEKDFERGNAFNHFKATMNSFTAARPSQALTAALTEDMEQKEKAASRNPNLQPTIKTNEDMMVDVTGASEHVARQYLERFKNNLSQAINEYMVDYPSAEEAVEI
ncbi:AAA domain-containing protein 10 [Elsinoe australis]|uniref:AAA domain-containing protein 10 n=1 Tax=Elsinoe australis TaxID=40998 RepID=A0A4U7APH1_9PEZI|nr:AAA domain-containing protein 10 [Elsinoe australis]